MRRTDIDLSVDGGWHAATTLDFATEGAKGTVMDAHRRIGWMARVPHVSSGRI
jgi:hypothetical protein